MARTEDFPERLDALVGDNMDDLKDSRGDSTGDVDYPARIDRSVVIGDSVRRVSVWSLRILFIAVAAYVGWLILGQLWRGVLPVILALIVCTVLSTPNMWLRKLKFPPALAAVTTIIIFFAAIAGVFWLIAPSIARQSQTLYYQVFDGILSVQLWLQGDPFNLDANDVDNFFNEVVGWLQNQAGTIAGEIFSGLGMATSVIITLGVVLVLTFFFLKDGDRFLSWGRQAVGETSGW
ncbi:MAG: AI-2E family transporter, partial [Corynebacterium sp.]|nr:AI-2E family transporter [Corynebacterium sp.]